MLLKPKTINIIKISSACLGACLVGSAIGVGYHFSLNANPYNDYFKRPTLPSDQSLEACYTAAAITGSQILVGAGFTHNSVISAINQNKYFKDKAFLGIDVVYSGNNPYNVATVNFKTEQSGFLAGIAAAQYLNENQDFFIDQNNPYLSYSAWGGISGQSVDSYLSGFQQGIIYFNDILLPKLKANKILINNHEYQKIYFACPSKFYSMGFSPSDATMIINEIITSHCKLLNADGTIPNLPVKNVKPSIVFPVAGPQTATLVTKILNSKLNIAVVGVDTAMEDDPNTTKTFDYQGIFPSINGVECKSIIPFSAIKDIEQSTQQILLNILNGVTEQKSATSFGGIGWYSVGDLNNDGAGISMNGHSLLKNIMVNAKIMDQTSDYNTIKQYFTSVYNLNDLHILKPTVIENNQKSHDYQPLRDVGWLCDSKKINEFVPVVQKFASHMSQKLTTMKNEDHLSQFKNATKLILSTPTSVLFDHSFSEATYAGIFEFYKKLGISIPYHGRK